jgi:ABC-type lipoprotein export system ATPase subunit
MELFQRLNNEQNITVILVTHESDIAAFAKRRVIFRDGVLMSDERSGEGER